MKKLVLIVALIFRIASAQSLNGIPNQNVQGSAAYITAAGSVNVMTGCPTASIAALSPGLSVKVLPNLANTTTTPTFNLCSLGAKTITKLGAAALVASDYTTTAIAVLIYDGTEWQLQNPQTSGGGGTSTPITCTVNTAQAKCLGVSPYVADGSGFWQTAINLAMNDLASNGLNGGTIYGCGLYPGGATPIDTGGGNAIYEAPTIPSVAGATTTTITFNGCTAITPAGGNANGMTLSTTNNTLGVNLFGAYSATSWQGHFTAVKVLFNHVNFSTTANANALNCLWCNALELHDVLMVGGGGSSPTGGTGLITPNISNNFEIVMDRVGIFGYALGALIHEHSQLDNFSVSADYNGIQFDSQDPSGNSIGGTNIWMQSDVNYLLGPSSADPTSIQLSRVDFESDPGTGFDITDPNSELSGSINYKKSSPGGQATTTGIITPGNPVKLALFNLVTGQMETSGGGTTGRPVSTVLPMQGAIVDASYPGSGGAGGLFAQEVAVAGTNSKIWDSIVVSPSLADSYLDFRTVNDAYNAANTWLHVTRTGFTPTLAAFNEPISATTGTFTTALTVAGNNVCQSTGSNCPAASSLPFSGLTSSTNTTAAMVVGAGASLAPSSTGTIQATSLTGVSALPNGVTATTQSGGDATTKVATDAFVSAAVAAAASGAGIVTYSGPSLTLSGTQYLPIGGGGLASTTETNVDLDSPAAASIQNFSVQMSAAPGVGNSVVFTWRKNAAGTTLTCTISGASATNCSDTTHTITVAAADLLDIQAVTTGTIVGTPTLVMGTQFGIAASSGVSSLAATYPLVASASTGAVTLTASTVPTNITAQVTIAGACALSGNQCIVSTPGATITFSSIPSGYSAIRVVSIARCSAAANNDTIYVQLNGDTAANYDYEAMGFTNNSVGAGQLTATAKPVFGPLACASAPTGAAGSTTLEIPGYTSGFLKNLIETTSSVVGPTFSSGFFLTGQQSAVVWNSTAAITQLLFGITGGSNFAANSAFEIYGIP